MLKTTAMCASVCAAAIIGANRMTANDKNTTVPHYRILESKTKLPVKLAPGDSAAFELDIADGAVPKRRSIRVEGMVEGTGKGEGAFRGRQSHLGGAVVDSGGKKVLLLWSDGSALSRKAFTLVRSQGLAKGEKLSVSVRVSAENLSIGKGGECGLRIEAYKTSGDVWPCDVSRAPDKTIFIPFAPGTYDGKVFSGEMKLPAEGIYAYLLSFGGKSFSGTARVETPSLKVEGKPLSVPKLDPKSGQWAQSNLSRLEWPEFEFAIDGKTFFSGACFQRAGNKYVDFELKLPPLRPGVHKLTARLTSSWPNAASYELKEIGLIEEPARAFEIVGAPSFVPEGAKFHVAVETNKKGVELKVEGKNAVPADSSVKFDEPGLHAVTLKAGRAGSPAEAVVSDGSRKAAAEIAMVTSGKPDGTLISTSDWIYIDEKATEKYFKWMLAEDIVNSVVIRPSYQWNGTRTRDKNYYMNVVKKLCGEFSLPYALMVEGRCLPGAMINPKDEWLKGPLYMGRQAHEDDGSYYYWGCWGPYPTDLVRIMMGRYLDGGGIFPKFRYRDNAVKNMKEGAEYFVANIKKAKHGSTRHTGPSVLFRYFYQAGYDWLGAEQFYGPEEIIMSALRGASRAYGKKDYGTHHATQWSIGGYNSQGHVELQFQSHAVAYMHGSSHINTEDALWLTENCEHRFSTWNKKHIERQKDMLDFIRTHRRVGEMATPIAVLQGKYDGWPSFGNLNVWGQKGDEWKRGPAEESFDLLRVFYPRKTLTWLSFGPTPYGPIDILPVEAPEKVMERYDALIFLGWNTFDDKYFNNLRKYVENGGTLMLTKAHLNANLRHNAPVELPENSDFVKKLLAAANKAKKSPAVVKEGKGSVIIFDTDAYPADKSIRPAYEEKMRALAAKAVDRQRSKGWIVPGANVEFAAWDAPAGDGVDRRIFLLDISTNGKEADFKLLLGKAEYDVKTPNGVIATIYVSNGLAAYPSDPLTSVLAIEKNGNGAVVTVQAIEPGTVTVFRNAAGSAPVSVKVEKPGIQKLNIVFPKAGGGK